MNRKAVIAALAPALLLSACDQTAPSSEGAAPEAPLETVDTVGTSEDDPAPAPAPTLISPVRDGVNDGIPDLTPPALTPEAERTETGARNVLLSFARAIELKEFDQAWALLSEGDRQKWSKAEFSKIFADLRTITVAAPSGTMEGAAGSSFYTAPITITADDKDGRPIHYQGEAVLRRVNDVEGATSAQLRWRFDKLTLDWTH